MIIVNTNIVIDWVWIQYIPQKGKCPQAVSYCKLHRGPVANFFPVVQKWWFMPRWHAPWWSNRAKTIFPPGERCCFVDEKKFDRSILFDWSCNIVVILVSGNRINEYIYHCKQLYSHLFLLLFVLPPQCGKLNCIRSNVLFYGP